MMDPPGYGGGAKNNASGVVFVHSNNINNNSFFAYQCHCNSNNKDPVVSRKKCLIQNYTRYFVSRRYDKHFPKSYKYLLRLNECKNDNIFEEMLKYSEPKFVYHEFDLWKKQGTGYLKSDSSISDEREIFRISDQEILNQMQARCEFLLTVPYAKRAYEKNQYLNCANQHENPKEFIDFLRKHSFSENDLDFKLSSGTKEKFLPKQDFSLK